MSSPAAIDRFLDAYADGRYFSALVNAPLPHALRQPPELIYHATLHSVEPHFTIVTPVFNGAASYRFETSKALQLSLLSQLGFKSPRTRIVNHPSLLPELPVVEAWVQALAGGEKVTGCTVHYVDAGIDSGEIIAQREVPIVSGDTPEILHGRIQIAERELYPEVIGRFCDV